MYCTETECSDSSRVKKILGLAATQEENLVKQLQCVYNHKSFIVLNYGDNRHLSVINGKLHALCSCEWSYG